MTQKDIQSVLQEDRVFPPSAAFSKEATLKDGELQRMYAKAEHDFVGFWADLAMAEINWHVPFTVPLDDSQAPNYRWFTDGQLNVSHNCLDVHLAARSEKIAIIFEGEPGDVRKLTYAELHGEVSRFANALKANGIGRGDRVVVYMPLIPEAVIAMQACARIGAVHSVVFGGFSSNAVKDRIEDAGAKLVITADGGWRGGHALELKRAVDKALADGCPSVQNVIVYRRTAGECPMQTGRDIWWHDAVSGQSAICEPEWVDAEHPLFLLYTSGSTGKPKGIQHSSGGYLLNAKTSTKWAFDLKDDDVFWCTADVGWVTGHTYVAYGPLAAGATLLMYEGAPTFPDGGRFWKICENHGVSIFYTAPTAIRALMKLGDAVPAKYDLSKLRVLGTVGEPINPEAWMWYHRIIGAERCPIVDTWWQTETGAAMMAPIPGVTPTKPGSCTKPLPGIFVDIVDDEGRSVKTPDAGGYLVIKRPWPSMLRTIWGDNERYIRTYWEKFQNRYYVAGDSARRDKDGYYWIMGRIDDVLNVAGHRLGTMEIESALVAHPKVAEAAVVSKPHEIKGESVFAYVVLNIPRPAGAESGALHEELRGWVAEQLSPIAKPDEIRLTDNLPKTRSGKIMRRLLRSIARGEEITQDMSTLENPGILEQLRGGAPPSTAQHAAPAKRTAGKKAAGKKVAGKKVSGKKVAARGKAKTAATVRSGAARGQTKEKKAIGAAKRAKAAKGAKATKGAKTAKSAKVGKSAKTAVKRGPGSTRVKSIERKAVAAKSRRTTTKAIRRKPRGKK
jgi:acetyl-CoA synthetase